MSLGRKGDKILLFLTGIIIVIGIAMLTSATSALAYKERGGDNYFFVKAQLLHLALGFLAFYVLAKVDYHFWRRWSWFFWLVGVILLVAVFIPLTADPKNNASSWIKIAGLSFQPVELAKLGFIIYLSTWLAEKSLNDIRDWYQGFLPFLVISGLPLILVLFQPDFGSFLIFAMISLAMFVIGGANLKQLGVLGLGAVVILPIMVKIKPHRFTSWLNPEAVATDAGWHLQQALIAIGSGGWFGRGFGNSIQKFYYLPEVAGDSIFAVIAEEMGFFVGVLIIFLFTAILYRGLMISSRAPDIYGKLLAVGLVSWIVSGAFVNIGSIIGFIPLTGLPLPFISQGGTALVTAMAAIGLLYNVSKHSVSR